MVVVTGFIFLQVILPICTVNRIQYLQVFFVKGCFKVDMQPIQVDAFLFVYTKRIEQKMLSYYGKQIIFVFCSVFSIHKIYIFCLFF